MCNIYACVLSLDASIYTHGDGGHIATPNEALHMYTLQYRFRKDNGRLTRWFLESKHETRQQAKEALGQHVATFFSFNARIINEAGETLGEYKYSK
jgi:hypothetical protein